MEGEDGDMYRGSRTRFFCLTDRLGQFHAVGGATVPCIRASGSGLVKEGRWGWSGGLALQQADCKQIRMGRWQTRKCQDVPRESA